MVVLPKLRPTLAITLLSLILLNPSLCFQLSQFSLRTSRGRQRPTSTSFGGSISIHDVQQELETSSINNKQQPIQKSVLNLPLSYYDESVTFLQRSTNTRIQGRDTLLETLTTWDEAFVADLGEADDRDGASNNAYGLERISMTSPTTMIIQWNVSYVPPTAQWLPNVAKTFRWTLEPTTYNDKSGQIRIFSYKAVFKVFADAIATQRLRVPLACIQGTTICEFDNDKDPKIISITENLAYAQELQRGVLQNRVCAQDLQAFLETARRPLTYTEVDWQDAVRSKLSWSSVPGLTDPSAIEPMEEDEEQWVPLVFLGGVGLFLLGFAYVLAPELIGQSLWGPPSYIVPPRELNDVIAY